MANPVGVGKVGARISLEEEVGADLGQGKGKIRVADSLTRHRRSSLTCHNMTERKRAKNKV